MKENEIEKFEHIYGEIQIRRFTDTSKTPPQPAWRVTPVEVELPETASLMFGEVQICHSAVRAYREAVNKARNIVKTKRCARIVISGAILDQLPVDLVCVLDSKIACWVHDPELLFMEHPAIFVAESIPKE